MSVTKLGDMVIVEWSKLDLMKYSGGAVLETPSAMTPKGLASMPRKIITPPFPDPNPSALCLCGCGQPVTPFTYNNSRLGRYKGHHPRYAHGHNKVKERGPRVIKEDRGFNTPCWIWQRAKNHNGYAVTSRSIGGGKNVTIFIHRENYERKYGPIPDGMQIDHLCRQRACVNPDHLEPVLPSENVRRGNVARLTKSQVADIKRLLAQELPRRVIAERFGVSTSVIADISRGRTWRGVGG